MWYTRRFTFTPRPSGAMAFSVLSAIQWSVSCVSSPRKWKGKASECIPDGSSRLKYSWLPLMCLIDAHHAQRGDGRHGLRVVIADPTLSLRIYTRHG